MKQIIIFLLLGLTSFLFLWCINIEPALSGKEYEEYQKNIKPELYYWNKYGTSEEQKTKDWVKCGGHPNGQFIWNEIQIKKEMRPNDINNDYYRYLAYKRLRNKTRNCMKNNGYKNLRGSAK